MATVTATIRESHRKSANRPRQFPRHRIGPLVYLELGVSNGGFPINVSEGGLGFQGILPLKKNQILSIKFKLPDVDGVVQTIGRVTWVNGIGTGGGLRFVDLSQESRLFIKNWISSEANLSDKYVAKDAVLKAGKAQSAAQLPEPSTTKAIVLYKPPVASFIPIPNTLAAKNHESIRKVKKDIANATPNCPAVARSGISETKVNRLKFRTRIVLVIATLTIMTVLGLVSVKFGRGVLLAKIRENINQTLDGPVSEAPSRNAVALGEQDDLGSDVETNGSSAQSALPAADSSLPSQLAEVDPPVADPQSSVLPTAPIAESRRTRGRVARRKRATKKSKTFTKPQIPFIIVRPSAAEFVAPIILLPNDY